MFQLKCINLFEVTIYKNFHIVFVYDVFYNYFYDSLYWHLDINLGAILTL
jgi:hypothetical protein